MDVVIVNSLINISDFVDQFDSIRDGCIPDPIKESIKYNWYPDEESWF